MVTLPWEGCLGLAGLSITNNRICTLTPHSDTGFSEVYGWAFHIRKSVHLYTSEMSVGDFIVQQTAGLWPSVFIPKCRLTPIVIASELPFVRISYANIYGRSTNLKDPRRLAEVRLMGPPDKPPKIIYNVRPFSSSAWGENQEEDACCILRPAHHVLITSGCPDGVSYNY